MQILVVEDNAEDAFLILQAFSTVEDCHVFVCRNLAEAKAYLEGEGLFSHRRKYPRPDAIISDLALAGESGLEFMTWLKQSAEFHSVPTCVLSGAVSNVDIARAQSLGAWRVMLKPRDLRTLERAMAQLIEELRTRPAESVYA